jgi:hypothetical protein
LEEAMLGLKAEMEGIIQRSCDGGDGCDGCDGCEGD